MRALAALVRVAQAYRRLESGAPAHLLLDLELPERLTGEQTRLHDLGESILELLRGERRQERRVDHRCRGPVERSDEVLPLPDVDADLSADRGVHLADERRRDRDPVDPAHVRGRNEPDEVGRRATAERDQRREAVDPQRFPQPLRLGERLVLDRVRSVDPVGFGRAHVGDDRVAPSIGVRPEPDPCRGEERALELACGPVGGGAVQGRSLRRTGRRTRRGRVRADARSRRHAPTPARRSRPDGA